MLPARRLLLTASMLLAAASLARADVDPNSGIDFVRITAPGNAAWPGDGTPGDRAVGRGSVGYEYRIGRFEVTTAQWVDFFNAAFDRPAGDSLPHVVPPTFWGAAGATPNNSTNPNARRWSVPAGNEMLPVGNISWRMAAMYCNWLHNDKALNREAFLNGAYDASTFTYFGNIFQDQQTHSPGARYWIPTWDEWLKAAHYDPNRNGPGQGGWWTYSNASDIPFIAGVPGLGTANFGGGGIANPYAIPLGAYTGVTSPWGLYDVAGATGEWTEEALAIAGTRVRLYEGSWWTDGPGVCDTIYLPGGDNFPSISTFDFGFRVAAIPTTSTILPLAIAGFFGWSAQRRRTCNETSAWNPNRIGGVPAPGVGDGGHCPADHR